MEATFNRKHRPELVSKRATRPCGCAIKFALASVRYYDTIKS